MAEPDNDYLSELINCGAVSGSGKSSFTLPADFVGGQSLRINDPVFYNWDPKEDISTYELALCTPVLCQSYISGMGSIHLEMVIEKLPDAAKRHFKRLERNGA